MSRLPDEDLEKKAAVQVTVMTDDWLIFSEDSYSPLTRLIWYAK